MSLETRPQTIRWWSRVLRGHSRASEAPSLASPSSPSGRISIKTDGLNYGPHIQDKQYDAVYIGGAVHHIPEVLLSTLKENGRLIAIVASHFPMQAICFERDSADNIKSTVLFETDAPYLIESSIQDADLFNF